MYKIDFAQANAHPWNAILYRLSIKPKGKCIPCPSPSHPDRNPSLHLYEGYGYCYPENKRFSKIDYVMAVLNKSSLDAAGWILNGRSAFTVKCVRPAEAKTQKDTSITQEQALKAAQLMYAEAEPIVLHDKALEIWKGWGLSELIANVFDIRVAVWGGCERILFPNFRMAKYDNMGSLIGSPVFYLVGLTGRRFDGIDTKRYYNQPGLEMEPFFLGVDQEFGLDVIGICEGQKDAVSGFELGIPTISLNGANANNVRNLRCRNWVVFADKDDRGDSVARDIQHIAEEIGANIKFYEGDCGKDLTDFLKSLNLQPPKESIFWILGDFPFCFEPSGLYVPGPVAYYEYAKFMNAVFKSRRS